MDRCPFLEFSIDNRHFKYVYEQNTTQRSSMGIKSFNFWGGVHKRFCMHILIFKHPVRTNTC